jgi:hypothetical protein
MHKTTVKLTLVFAALFASSAAFGFNPQPDPPGKQKAIAGTPTHTAFNPQPDPPGKQATTGCPQATDTQRDAASGLPSGKRTVDANPSGAPCGLEHPK